MIDEHHPLDLKGIYCLGVLPAIERAQQQIPTAVPLRLYDINLMSSRYASALARSVLRSGILIGSAAP